MVTYHREGATVELSSEMLFIFFKIIGKLACTEPTLSDEINQLYDEILSLLDVNKINFYDNHETEEVITLNNRNYQLSIPLIEILRV